MRENIIILYQLLIYNIAEYLSSNLAQHILTLKI